MLNFTFSIHRHLKSNLIYHNAHWVISKYVANVTTNDTRQDGGCHNSGEWISWGKRSPQGLRSLDKIRGWLNEEPKRVSSLQLEKSQNSISKFCFSFMKCEIHIFVLRYKRVVFYSLSVFYSVFVSLVIRG